MPTLPPWNRVDLIVAVVLAAGAIGGVIRGLSGELASLLSLLIVAVGSFFLYPAAAAFTAQHSGLAPDAARAAALGVFLLVAFLVALLLRKALQGLFRLTFPPLFDRVAGAAFGGVLALVVCAAVLLLLLKVPDDALQRTVGHESWAGRTLTRFEARYGRQVRTGVVDVRDAVESRWPSSTNRPGRQPDARQE